jgi:hypothetical protein
LKEESYLIVKIKSLNFTEREYIGDKKNKQNIVLDKNIIDKKISEDNVSSLKFRKVKVLGYLL